MIIPGVMGFLDTDIYIGWVIVHDGRTLIAVVYSERNKTTTKDTLNMEVFDNNSIDMETRMTNLSLTISQEQREYIDEIKGQLGVGG